MIGERESNMLLCHVPCIAATPSPKYPLIVVLSLSSLAILREAAMGHLQKL